MSNWTFVKNHRGKKNQNEKYRSNLASHLILFSLVLGVYCGRNSLQVIHPVTVGRCNPLAVTRAVISPTMETLAAILLTVPRVSCGPALEGEGTQ